MKRKLSLWLIAASLLLTIPMTSACWPGIKGNGIVVKSTRNLTGFKSVSVSAGLELYLTQADVESVMVEADENLQENIKTEVENGELKIYVDKPIMKAKSKKIYVNIKEIEALMASSGSEVESSLLKVAQLKVSSSSGAEVDLMVAGENIVADVSSGADIEIKGNAESIEASASSGSDLDADELICRKGSADVSSGGQIEIHVTESIKADASSGGQIDVYGNPAMREVNTSSGGNVNYK